MVEQISEVQCIKSSADLRVYDIKTCNQINSSYFVIQVTRNINYQTLTI